MYTGDSNTIKISNTPLAAYLVSEGFNVEDVEHNGTRAYFLFKRDNNKIDDFIRLYETARAEGNIVLFFNAYQSLLRRIREK